MSCTSISFSEKNLISYLKQVKILEKLWLNFTQNMKISAASIPLHPTPSATTRRL